MDIGIESLQFDSGSIYVKFGVTFIMFFDFFFFFLSLICGVLTDDGDSIKKQPYTRNKIVKTINVISINAMSKMIKSA